MSRDFFVWRRHQEMAEAEAARRERERQDKEKLEREELERMEREMYGLFRIILKCFCTH